MTGGRPNLGFHANVTNEKSWYNFSERFHENLTNQKCRMSGISWGVRGDNSGMFYGSQPTII